MLGRKRLGWASAIALSGCVASGPVADLDARVTRRDATAPSCATPGSAGDGAPCRCGADCAVGAACSTETESGTPGGVCLHACDPAVATSCGTGTTCSTLASAGACVPSCTAPSDCPAGRVCGGGTCLPYCASDAECVETGHCNAYTGLCDDGTPPVGAGSLEPCVRPDDCASGFCDPGVHRCATSCSLSRGGCPGTEICMEDADLGDDLGGCVPRCSSTGECPVTGLRCVLTTIPSGTARVCVP